MQCTYFKTSVYKLFMVKTIVLTDYVVVGSYSTDH